jgi:hypothetical protein
MVRALALLPLLALSHLALAAPTSDVGLTAPELTEPTDELASLPSAITEALIPAEHHVIPEMALRDAMIPSSTSLQPEAEAELELDTTPNTLGKLDHLPDVVHASDITPEVLADLAELQAHSGSSGMTNAQRMARGEPLLAPRKRTAPRPKAKPKPNREGAERMDKRQSIPNFSQPASKQYSCGGSRPFANRCLNAAGDGTSGNQCFFSFGTYNTGTW